MQPVAQQKYPARYEKRLPAQVAARARDLQRASSGLLDDVDLDEYGLARVVRSGPRDGPPPARLDLAAAAPWIALIKSAPDVFGMDDTTEFVEVGTYVVADQVVGDETIGRITIEVRLPFPSRAWAVVISGHLWPGVPPMPRTSVNQQWLAWRLVGRIYDATETFGPPPCAWGTPCVAPPPRSSTVTVTADMLRPREMTRLVHRPGDDTLALRRIIRVDLVPPPSGGSMRYAPRGGAAPLPFVIDAVTGDEIPKGTACAGAGCTDW
jgi:hypothetical protein